MLNLIVLSEVLRISAPQKIAELTKTDPRFKLAMEGIPVSKESVIRYGVCK